MKLTCIVCNKIKTEYYGLLEVYGKRKRRVCICVDCMKKLVNVIKEYYDV